MSERGRKRTHLSNFDGEIPNSGVQFKSHALSNYYMRHVDSLVPDLVVFMAGPRSHPIRIPA